MFYFKAFDVRSTYGFVIMMIIIIIMMIFWIRIQIMMRMRIFRRRKIKQSLIYLFDLHPGNPFLILCSLFKGLETVLSEKLSKIKPISDFWFQSYTCSCADCLHQLPSLLLLPSLFPIAKPCVGPRSKRCWNTNSSTLLVTPWISYRHFWISAFNHSRCDLNIQERTVAGPNNWMLLKESLRVSSHSILITLDQK